MDILAAIDLMSSADAEVAAEAAAAVRGWVLRGGFIPEGWDRAALLATAHAVLDGGAVVTLDEV